MLVRENIIFKDGRDELWFTPAAFSPMPLNAFIQLRFEEVESVEFARQGGGAVSSRTFDLLVRMKNEVEHQFRCVWGGVVQVWGTWGRLDSGLSIYPHTQTPDNSQNPSYRALLSIIYQEH